MKQAPVLNDKQVKKLFNSPKMTKYESRNRLILSLSYYAGLRSVEICSLCIGDVLNGDGSIKDTILLKSHQTKGNESHTVVLSAHLRGELERYVSDYTLHRERLTAPLIKSQKGGFFSSQSLQNLFKHLYKSVGFDDCSSHSGRRKFASSLDEKNVSIGVIKSLLRHSHISSTQRYIQVSKHRLENSVNMLSY
jgi:integrase/recombinase XerD